MSLLRWIFGLFITLLMIIVAAIVVVPKLFDPNDYRDQITQLVKDHTQRNLVLEEGLKLSVFPWLGVTTGKLSFSQPIHLSKEFGEGNMLEVAAAKVHLKVLPLLKSLAKEVKDIQIDTIVLQQPQIEIITLENGLNSLSGLSGDGSAVDESSQQFTNDQQVAAAAGVALVVQGVDLQSGRLVWDDRQAKQRYELREFNVNTGNLIGENLADIVASGEIVDSNSPDVIQFDLKGNAQIDVESLAAVVKDMKIVVERGDISTNAYFTSLHFAQNAQITIQQLSVKVAMSDEEIGPITADISVPSLGFDQASELLLIDTLQAKGTYQQRPTQLALQDLRFSLQDKNASLERVVTVFDGLTANVTEIRASNVFDEPQGEGKLVVQPFNARRLIDSFDVEFSPSSDSALTNVFVSTDFSASLDKVDLQNFKATIDESQLDGFMTVRNFANPTAQFDLSLNLFNVDDYLPTTNLPTTNLPAKNVPASGDSQVATDSSQTNNSQTSSSAEALLVPLALFEKFKANGIFRAGTLIASGVTIQDIMINVASDSNSTTITPEAKLYDGSFGGKIRYENVADGARLTVNNDLSSVNLEGLLTDADVTEQLSGIANLGINLVVEEINGKQTNHGVISLGAKEGVIKGIDIQKILRKANDSYQQFKGQQLKGRAIEDNGIESDQTKFASLGGTFELNDYQVDNLDFDMKAPLFRVSGAGKIDLLQQILDYTVKISVVNSLSGQDGEELEKLKGITLPVRFTGALTSPKYSLDTKALFKSALGSKVDERKEELLKEKLGIEGGGKLSSKDILKAAIGKKIEEKYGSKQKDAQSPELTESTEKNSQVAQDARRSNSDDLNQATQQPSAQEQPQEPVKTKKQLKKELKEELKRKALESLFGG